MDTFMDQLSQKLNAQQIIRANGEAESEAMGVMRAQVREYQDCLDRMKNVADELGGLQQTIAALPDMNAGSYDAALDDIKAQMATMNKANEDYLQQMQSDLLASQNDFIARQKDLAQSQNELMSRQSEMLERSSNELREQIESIRTSNEERLESIKASNEEQFEKIRSGFADNAGGAGLEEVSARLGVLDEVSLRLDALDGISTRLDALGGISARLDALEGLSARLDLLEAQIGTQLGDLRQGIDAKIDSKVDPVKESVSSVNASVNSVSETVGALSASVGEINASVRASGSEISEKLSEQLGNTGSDEHLVELVEVLRDEVSAMKLQMESVRSSNDQYMQQMQSNLRKGQEQMLQGQNSLAQTLGNADIHKECVRVYRNVQASIQDENSKQLESFKQENSALLENLKTEGSRNITVIRDESAKLLGSLRNDGGKQLENFREENSKLLVSMKSEVARVEEKTAGIKTLAVIAVILSLLSVAAPFLARFLF